MSPGVVAIREIVETWMIRYIQTFPYRGSTEIASTPYSRDIGGLLLREELRMAFEGQPDWMGVIEE